MYKYKKYKNKYLKLLGGADRDESLPPPPTVPRPPELDPTGLRPGQPGYQGPTRLLTASRRPNVPYGTKQKSEKLVNNLIALRTALNDALNKYIENKLKILNPEHFDRIKTSTASISELIDNATSIHDATDQCRLFHNLLKIVNLDDFREIIDKIKSFNDSVVISQDLKDITQEEEYILNILSNFDDKEKTLLYISMYFEYLLYKKTLIDIIAGIDPSACIIKTDNCYLGVIDEGGYLHTSPEINSIFQISDDTSLLYVKKTEAYPDGTHKVYCRIIGPQFLTNLLDPSRKVEYPKITSKFRGVAGADKVNDYILVKKQSQSRANLITFDKNRNLYLKNPECNVRQVDVTTKQTSIQEWLIYPLNIILPKMNILSQEFILIMMAIIKQYPELKTGLEPYLSKLLDYYNILDEIHVPFYDAQLHLLSLRQT